MTFNEAIKFARAGLGLILMTALLTFLCVPMARAEKEAEISVDKLLNKLEARYDGVGVSARFKQRSTLKVMDITDTAEGRAFFKPPGMMRWEYLRPEPQQIITDGRRLWIYKPEESQVVVGKAPTLFGEDSGVNLFANIGKIRDLFDIHPVPDRGQADRRVLKLVPREKISDITKIYITISLPEYDLVEIETVNPYGDTTIIAFTETERIREMDDDLFSFDIPVDADVINMGGQP